MPRFRKVPEEIEAVRYGSEESGEWYGGAIQTLARFILDIRTTEDVSDAQIFQVLRPLEIWDPPSECALEFKASMIDPPTRHRVIRLGDWLVKGHNHFYTMSAEEMREMYKVIE